MVLAELHIVLDVVGGPGHFSGRADRRHRRTRGEAEVDAGAVFRGARAERGSHGNQRRKVKASPAASDNCNHPSPSQAAGLASCHCYPDADREHESHDEDRKDEKR
jgi:hypothetical protein